MRRWNINNVIWKFVQFFATYTLTHSHSSTFCFLHLIANAFQYFQDGFCTFAITLVICRDVSNVLYLHCVMLAQLLYIIMKRQFKQWWSAISTKQTTTSHRKPPNTNKGQDIYGIGNQGPAFSYFVLYLSSMGTRNRNSPNAQGIIGYRESVYERVKIRVLSYGFGCKVFVFKQ